MKKSGFIFRAEWIELFQQLDVRQRGLLISAMIEYYGCGNDRYLKDPALRMVFAAVKGFIDQDKASAADVSEKRRTAAKARWDMQNMQTMQMHANDANACFASDEGACACTCADDKVLSDKESNIIIQEKEKSKKKNKVFQPPAIEEVRAYCEERHNGIDAEQFFAFYESKGWMIGKNRMKNWRMAVITWEKDRGFRKGSDSVKPKVSLNEVSLL